MKRAFSFVELLVVVVIIGLLAALTFPLISRAKVQARKEVTKSAMKQVWTGVALYREDWGGGAVFGNMFDMGLPPAPGLALKPQGSEFYIWGVRADRNECLPKHYYAPPEMEKFTLMPWTDYVSRRQGAAVMFATMGYTDPTQPFGSPFTKYFALGMTESGGLVQKLRTGDPNTESFWHSD